MSTDLEGWYISKRILSNPNIRLSAPMPNMSYFEGFNWWDADEKVTFLDQVEAVKKKMEEVNATQTDFFSEEEIQKFTDEAMKLQTGAEAKGSRVRSYWL